MSNKTPPATSRFRPLAPLLAALLAPTFEHANSFGPQRCSPSAPRLAAWHHETCLDFLSDPLRGDVFPPRLADVGITQPSVDCKRDRRLQAEVGDFDHGPKLVRLEKYSLTWRAACLLQAAEHFPQAGDGDPTLFVATAERRLDEGQSLVGPGRLSLPAIDRMMVVVSPPEKVGFIDSVDRDIAALRVLDERMERSYGVVDGAWAFFMRVQLFTVSIADIANRTDQDYRSGRGERRWLIGRCRREVSPCLLDGASDRRDPTVIDTAEWTIPGLVDKAVSRKKLYRARAVFSSVPK